MTAIVTHSFTSAIADDANARLAGKVLPSHWNANHVLTSLGNLTKTDDTNVTLTLGGIPTGSLIENVSLTLGWMGKLGLLRGGTNADLSATGGTGQYLKQSSAGAAVTVGTIPAADLPSSFSGLANPTASLGLTAVNGTATTAMRSDAAPSLDISISPTWTGTHTFSNATHSASFTGGPIQSGKYVPVTDGTTAIQFLNAGASSTIIDIDTTNKRVGINTTPRLTLDVSGPIVMGSGTGTINSGPTPDVTILGAVNPLEINMAAGANNPFTFLATDGSTYFLFDINRRTATGVFQNPSATHSRFQMNSSNGSGSIEFRVTNTNNVLAPVVFTIGGAQITAVNPFLANSSILSNGASGGIGYSTGAGGAVTQLTSKSTGVTLNTVTGQITMNGAALAASTAVSFTLTNSAIAATDLLLLSHQSSGTNGAYSLNAQCAAGSAAVSVRNLTAGSLSEAIVISFAVIKGVTS